MVQIWVVTKPTTGSTLQDICFETDAIGLAKQFKGGLNESEISDTFNNETDAIAHAKFLLNETNYPDGAYGMKVTSVQVYPMKEMGKTKALARIVLNDSLQLTGLRVVEGASGLFVSYPQDLTYKGEDYRSVFYPVTKDLREYIEEQVLIAFNKIQK
jgi:stage V sporulation protein G